MTTTKPKSMSTMVIGLIALAGCAVLTVPCIGVVSAIAIPAFVGYVRRSKTVEATANVAAIRLAIAAYAMGETVDPATGQMRMRGLPPSLPLTPPTQGAERRAWPSDADAGWSEIGFSVADPIYYSYEVVTDRAAGTVTVRAIGDLDGDTTTSEFLTHGRFDPATGEIAWDPGLTITNELE